VSARKAYGGSPRFVALRGYLAATAALDLAWEAAQLPLYTIWKDGTSRSMALAVLHCTAGDVLLAFLVLVGALLLVGDPAWPSRRAGRVAALTLVAGLACTVLIEWLMVEVWPTWAYSDLMPLLPPLGTGLSPVLQWLLVPSVALWTVHRTGAAHQLAR